MGESGNDRQVASYLAANPDFLERYVLRNVDVETLERWTIRRARLLQNHKASNGGNYLYIPSFIRIPVLFYYLVYRSTNNILNNVILT